MPEPAPLYVVSRRKFAILFLATSGLYVVYWTYKNWDRYKGCHPAASTFGTTVWPVPRAVFAIFFTHALLRAVRRQGREALARWHNDWLASAIVALLVLQNVIDIPLGGTVGEIASMAVLLPLLWCLLRAQAALNLACGDLRGASNDRLSKANWFWIVVGGLVWLDALYDLLASSGQVLL